MNSGYISKVHIHGIDLERYAQTISCDPALYFSEINVALCDLEGYRDFALKNELPAEQHVCFLDSQKPVGPYDLHVFCKRADQAESETINGHEYRWVRTTQNLILGFSTSDSSDIFYEHIFPFRHIRNSLRRYYNIIREHERNSAPREHRLQDIIYGDLNREEGHEGIIARLFPLNYNHHLRMEGEHPDYEIDFGLACSIFSLFRAVFPPSALRDDYQLEMESLPSKPTAMGTLKPAPGRTP